MSGIDHENRVKLEPNRSRLNIPDPREQKRRQEFPITQTTMDPTSDFLKQLSARSLFQKSNHRFYVRMELDDFWIEPRFLR